MTQPFEKPGAGHRKKEGLATACGPVGDPHEALRKRVVLRMPHFTQSYRNLLAFIGSMSYTDFGTIHYSVVRGLLQEAGVVSEQEVYMVDVPPYTTPAIELRFEIVQETGHRNTIRLTFTEQEQLTEFHLRTS